MLHFTVAVVLVAAGYPLYLWFCASLIIHELGHVIAAAFRNPYK